MAYTADNIQVLKGLEGVRARPAMYVGDSGKKGLHHLVYEILDNSVDEVMAGYCNKIYITIHKDGETITIEDNGRGIPVSKHPTENKSALEVVFTVLHAGGKFDANSYNASGGLHGVGASCVNALSDYLYAEIKRDGSLWGQEYSKGIPKYNVKKIKDISAKESGTKVTFKADKTIFKDGIQFDETWILKRIQETVFLNKNLSIYFKNEKTGLEKNIECSNGIIDYIKYLTEHKKNNYPIDGIYGEIVKTLTSRIGNVNIEIALIYSDDDDENIISFVNNINTIDGGTHLSGFKTALTRSVNQFARDNKILKEKDNNLTGDDVREGLTAIVNIKFPQPEFVGQTKAKLGTTEIESIVTSGVSELISNYFNHNASVANKIINRAILAQKARNAAKKQSALIKRKSVLGNHRLPGKLSDCNSNKREICELFIVEGNSASGSCKSGRDPETQAILPLRGKITNAEKTSTTDLLDNKEIQSLIMAIGTGIKDEFDINKRRYDKIILTCDADEDGSHITILLITFFYKYMRQLITKGFVYLAHPPLFKVYNENKTIYCFNEQEMQKAFSDNKNSKVVRFKGLGEMDPNELSETTMQKDKRKLIQINADDAAEAERLLSILMGSNPQLRKDHIVNKINELIA